MNEERAKDLAQQAVDLAGGNRLVYGNPRHPFAKNPTTTFEIDGHVIEIRHGEISSPAIATVEGWIFQILDEEVELLMPPRQTG